MPEVDVIYVDNPPRELAQNRAAISKLFKQFGPIAKLFIDDRNLSYIKVYYAKHESVSLALISVQNAPPYFLKLRVVRENVHKDKLNKFSKRLEANSTNLNESRDSLSSVSINIEDQINDMPTSNLYDIFGREIPIYDGESGQQFVSVDDLRKHDFHLFTESDPPPPITEEDYLQQLKIYLAMKIRKFQLLHQDHIIAASTTNAIINQAIQDYVDGKPQASPKAISTNTPTNSIQQNRIRSLSSTPIPKISNDRDLCNNSPRNGVVDDKANNSLNQNNFKQNFASQYEIVRMPINQPVEVSITHVLNERRCYVYLKSREPTLRALHRRVEIEAKKSAPVTPVVGQIYAADYENAWYRAIVRQTNPLKVLYIDYGNINDVPLKEVRSLSSALCAEPAEGICINFGTNPIASNLDFGTVLNVIALRENTDKSYQVKKASESNNKPQLNQRIEMGSLNADRNKENVDKNIDGNIENDRRKSMNFECKFRSVEIEQTKQAPIQQSPLQSLTQPRIQQSPIQQTPIQQTPIQQTSVQQTPIQQKPIQQASSQEKIEQKPSTSVTHNLTATMKEKLAFKISSEKKTDTRRTIVETYGTGSGLIDYLNTIDGNDIFFVALQQAVEKELNDVEEISSESIKDDSYIAKPGDMVAVYNNPEEKWVRGVVVSVKNNTYSVAQVDYGEIEDANAIRKLPNRFLNMGEFACVCKGSEMFLKIAKEKTSQILFEVLNKNRLKVILPNGNTEEIDCIKWNPVGNVTEEQVKEEPVFTIRPKRMQLQEGELCKISDIINGKLLVKTKECIASFKQIKQVISAYQANTLSKQPIVGQLALCDAMNQELFRVVVLNINKNTVEVEYIDVGITAWVDINSLKTISQELATIEIPIIPITLLDFEGDKLTEAIIQEIKALGATRFITKHFSNDTYDLLSETTLQSLSKSLKKNCDRVLYSDIPQTTQSGNIKVLCLSSDDANGSTFIRIDDNSIDTLDTILEAAKMLQYNDPYVPVVDEVCFVLWDSDWNRGRIIKADPDTDKFEVLFIDYGSKDVVSSSDIRKLNDELKTVPIVSMICRINDPSGSEISQGQHYDISVVDRNENGLYTVRIVS